MSFIRKRIKVLGSLVLALMLSISCITPAFAVGAEPTWSYVAPMLAGRSAFSCEVFDGKIYVLGGWSGKSKPNELEGSLNTVEQYDPVTNVWTAKAPMPESCAYSKSVLLNGLIYVVGGENRPNTNTSGTNIKNIYIYNPSTDVWSTATGTTGRNQHEIAVLDGKIYIIGGWGTSTSVEMFDPQTGSFTTKASMQTGHNNFTTAVLNGRIYVIGGSDSNKVEEYNPLTNTWTTKAPLNLGRQKPESVVLDNKIYVAGGYDYAHSTFANSLEVYDPALNTWTTEAPMSLGRTSFQLIEADGEIFSLGGWTGGEGINSVEQYDPQTNTWVTKAPMSVKKSSFQACLIENTIYAMGGNVGSTSFNSVEKYTLPAVAPTAPTGLTATAGDSKVDLSWGSVTGATSYNVYRSTTSGGTYTKIAEGLTGTTYTDSTVTNGTTYYYVVSAVTSGSESAYSNEVSATPQKSQSEAGFAIVDIYMVDGTLKEYDLPMAKVNEFIEWYDQRAAGTGKSYFIIEKTYNKGPFKARKDYIVFDKIKDFEVNQYD